MQPRTFAAAWEGGRSLVIGSSKLSVFESAFVGSTEDEAVTLATAFSARAGLLLHCALDKIALFDAHTGAVVQRLDHLLEHGSSDVTACTADPQMRKLFLVMEYAPNGQCYADIGARFAVVDVQMGVSINRKT